MNDQNLDYLKKSLDYLGFGTRLNDVLSSAIAKELPSFTLGITQNYNSSQGPKNTSPADQLKFQLNFNKSKQSDMYFLNDYEVTLTKGSKPVSVKQVFDLERDSRITALQAYKLLSGHSLEKDVYLKAENGESPEKKKVWFKLNLEVQDAYGNHPLNKFYPEFKFDLSATIDKYPFKNLDETTKEALMKSMRNGNLAKAEFIIAKKTVPVFLNANPQFKGLDVFDKNMSIIRQDDIFPEKAEDRKNENQRNKNQDPAAYSAQDQSDRFPWEENDRDVSSEPGIER